ncbi:alpha/beta fold hydrolase [Parahaliea mediterranea]|uniref:Alpha/beta fold hydrolase n=1 Tax=Parahaliea mediterranea TaxID=651086 RepID=A0A939DEZ6_9GAMM|nr:alpha/beta fold hydrolase [Parahaliea mediterranea]
MEITPFRIDVANGSIDDLRRRIDQTRWPDQLDGVGWQYGTEREYLRELVHYWRHHFNWRQQEALINRFSQYRATIDDFRIHFIHQRSSHQDATPLLMTHGWPSSIVEFLDVIEPLTEPEKYCGCSADAFHVVCPSLPGFAYSSAPRKAGTNVRDIAKIWLKLMRALGYERFIVQGGDFGAMVSTQLAGEAPAHLLGIHLSMQILFPTELQLQNIDKLSPPERAGWDELEGFVTDKMGYHAIQSTKPQTLGYGLHDSPVGFCAWLTEKFHDWTDCEGEIRNAVSWDRLLTNISLLWFSESVASCLRIYRDCNTQNPAPHVPYVSVPTGCARFPREVMKPPRAWAEEAYNLIFWSEHEKGGHFAAMEQPEAFAQSLRGFKGALREASPSSK